jgi:hypothetical protein
MNAGLIVVSKRAPLLKRAALEQRSDAIWFGWGEPASPAVGARAMLRLVGVEAPPWA